MTGFPLSLKNDLKPFGSVLSPVSAGRDGVTGPIP